MELIKRNIIYFMPNEYLFCIWTKNDKSWTFDCENQVLFLCTLKWIIIHLKESNLMCSGGCSGCSFGGWLWWWHLRSTKSNSESQAIAMTISISSWRSSSFSSCTCSRKTVGMTQSTQSTQSAKSKKTTTTWSTVAAGCSWCLAKRFA